MKVLFLSPFYYPNLIGGSEITIKLLAEALVKRGLEVTVVSFDGERYSEENINGVKLIRLRKSRIKPITLAVNISLLRNKNIIRRENPNIIHVYNTWNIPSSYFMRDISPVIATLNNYFPLCPIDHTIDNSIEKGKTSFFDIIRGTYKTLKGNPLKRYALAFLYSLYNRITLPFSKRIDIYVVYANAIEIYMLDLGSKNQNLEEFLILFYSKKKQKTS